VDDHHPETSKPMTKNFAANLKIGAVMSSTVGRVFGALKTKIKDQEATLKGLRAAYKDAAKGTGEYAGRLDELKGKIESTEKELKRLRDAAKFDLGKSLKGVGNTFLGDAKRLAAGAGILVGATVAVGGAIYATTKGFVDWADDIGDSAEALNMSTQALQTWQFAAATVGVEGSKMTATIAKFQKTIADGGKATEEVLSTLGVNGKRLKKLSIDDQLLVIAEAFKQYQGPGNKAAMAMKLFGKSGYQLTGILNKGADGMKEFRKLGEETGAVLTDDAAKAAGDAASALDTFGITMTGLRNTIAIQFVPVLQRLVEKFTGFVRREGPQIREWASRFASTIEDKVVPALGRFFDKLPGIIDQIADIGTKFWGVLTSVKDFLGGWDNLGIALVAVNFAPTIATVGNMTASLWTMTGATWAAVGPWLAIGAAIGAVYLILTNQEKVGAWFEAMMGKDDFEALGLGMIEFGKALEKFQEDVTEAAIDIAYEWRIAREAMEKFFNSQIESGVNAVNVVKAAFQSFFTWLSNQWNLVGAAIDGMWNRAKSLGDTVKGLFSFGGSPAPSGPPIAPPANMPSPDRSTSMNNKVDIHVNTNATDGRTFGQQLRQELQRKPLFDMDGALVPG
jgi:hypothetical protein